MCDEIKQITTAQPDWHVITCDERDQNEPYDSEAIICWALCENNVVLPMIDGEYGLDLAGIRDQTFIHNIIGPDGLYGEDAQTVANRLNHRHQAEANGEKQ